MTVRFVSVGSFGIDLSLTTPGGGANEAVTVDSFWNRGWGGVEIISGNYFRRIFRESFPSPSPEPCAPLWSPYIAITNPYHEPTHMQSTLDHPDDLFGAVPDWPPVIRATLGRVPDEIILSVATREFTMDDPLLCLCGWLAREGLAREQDIAAEDAYDMSGVIGGSVRDCTRLYGGTPSEWQAISSGVVYVSPSPYTPSCTQIEDAFTLRVMEAVK